ncbi:MAG: MOSC domain-containing protein [Bacteroidota bacterium]|nr:MOSC domain-containing protein [Bacteroidota bacterium]
MRRLSQIFIYPVKGLKGISLDEALIDNTGLQYDRRWMLVDETGTFMSQRTHPIMASFKLVQTEMGFDIWEPKAKECIAIPKLVTGSKVTVKIWNDTCEVVSYSKFADAWFSTFLEMKCKLVYMPDDCNRAVETEFNRGSDTVSFADAYPILLIGDESMADLNNRLNTPVNIDRFRPNLVFTGGTAFEEDTYSEFSIGSHHFLAARPCGRCKVPGVNQQTGKPDKAGKELLKTLAKYRTQNNKVYFGQNVLSNGGSGIVKLGDALVNIY